MYYMYKSWSTDALLHDIWMIYEWFVSHTLHVYTILHLQMLYYMIYLMTYQWSVSHTLHAYTTCIVMIYIIIYIAPLHGSFHTHGWVMLHIWMSHVTHINTPPLALNHKSQNFKPYTQDPPSSPPFLSSPHRSPIQLKHHIHTLSQRLTFKAKFYQYPSIFAFATKWGYPPSKPIVSLWTCGHTLGVLEDVLG